jgi:hypothetical protein
MKPVIDKAEVSIDFPDKAYMGSFGHDAEFDVRPESDGVVLKLVHRGDQRREVGVHLHYYLLADIVEQMAAVLAEQPEIDEAHRAPLFEAAKGLQAALKKRKGSNEKRARPVD